LKELERKRRKEAAIMMAVTKNVDYKKL